DETRRQVGIFTGGLTAFSMSTQVRTEDAQPSRVEHLGPTGGPPIHREVGSEPVQKKHRYGVDRDLREQIRIVHCDIIGKVHVQNPHACAAGEALSAVSPGNRGIFRSTNHSVAKHRSYSCTSKSSRRFMAYSGGGVSLTRRVGRSSWGTVPTMPAPEDSFGVIAKVTKGAPTGTTSSSAACNSTTRPARGEGMTTADLVVSTSTSGALRSIVSPTATCHSRTVASTRPSPRSGRVKMSFTMSAISTPKSAAPRATRGRSSAGTGVPGDPPGRERRTR